MMNTTAEISEDEAALYDRQIRLWGLEAQKRLRCSKVMISSMGGLAAEVSKNLILAGVNSLTMVDSQKVSEDDFCSQFLILDEDLNKNRAESSLTQACLLNPMVTVTADTEDISKKSDDFFSKFDVVIVTEASKREMIRIDNICRAKNVKFFAGSVHGFFGYAFLDLMHHEYVQEIEVAIPIASADTKQKIRKETKTLKKSLTFCPLQDALNKDWAKENNSSELKKLSSSYFILQCLLEFHNRHGRYPSNSSRSSDAEELRSIRDNILEKMGVNVDKVDNEFANVVFSQFSPVCAIVGGIMAQEVIKAVSHKDMPIDNFFFYYGLKDSGTAERIGS